MKCTNHPEIEADGMCTYCGKPFCKDCLVEVKGKMYCKADLGNVIDEAKSASANSQPTINITNTSSNVNTNTNTNTNANGCFSYQRRSKLVALILDILGFFGLAGLHRFYVGKTGSGILYLFTCGLCGIGTVIDLITIITGAFRDNCGQPLV